MLPSDATPSQSNGHAASFIEIGGDTVWRYQLILNFERCYNSTATITAAVTHCVVCANSFRKARSSTSFYTVLDALNTCSLQQKQVPLHLGLIFLCFLGRCLHLPSREQSPSCPTYQQTMASFLHCSSTTSRTPPTWIQPPRTGFASSFFASSFVWRLWIAFTALPTATESRA